MAEVFFLPFHDSRVKMRLNKSKNYLKPCRTVHLDSHRTFFEYISLKCCIVKGRLWNWLCNFFNWACKCPNSSTRSYLSRGSHPLYFLGCPRTVFTACLSSQDYIYFLCGAQVWCYLPTNLAESCTLASTLPQISVYQDDIFLHFSPVVSFVISMHNSSFSRWHTDKSTLSYQCKPQSP